VSCRRGEAQIVPHETEEGIQRAEQLLLRQWVLVEQPRQGARQEP